LFQAPRGTQDILPEDQRFIHFIQEKVKVLAHLYGYYRIDTPTFEEAGLFVRTVGEGTDIVEKEMYTFTDLSGGQMTLRPEGTAPVCRAYIEHGMASLAQPIKLYYHAPIFRYERPQAGRFRQHHQFGFEAIGEADASLDAEMIDMAWRLFASLGLQSLTLQINSIGCSQCRPAYLGKLKEYYRGLNAELCGDCKVRLEKNTLRLLDCKKTTCQPFADGSPHSATHLCSECDEHFGQLRKNLNALGLTYSINPRLVRGLDYYNKTVFEIQPADEGGQSTLAGGGRYDGLIAELGGHSTPAVGFATGIERIVLNLKKQNICIPEIAKPVIYVAWLGEVAREVAIKTTVALRRNSISTLCTYTPRSLKSQLRQADGAGCRYVAIIGEDEVTRGVLTLRDLDTAQQEAVTIERLAEELTNRTSGSEKRFDVNA